MHEKAIYIRQTKTENTGCKYNERDGQLETMREGGGKNGGKQNGRQEGTQTKMGGAIKKHKKSHTYKLKPRGQMQDVTSWLVLCSLSVVLSKSGPIRGIKHRWTSDKAWKRLGGDGERNRGTEQDFKCPGASV